MKDKLILLGTILARTALGAIIVGVLALVICLAVIVVETNLHIILYVLQYVLVLAACFIIGNIAAKKWKKLRTAKKIKEELYN